MGESSRRCSRRSSRKEKRARCRPLRSSTASPPTYSVEENTQGELVNYRLNVKWPQPVDKHRERRQNSSPRRSSRKEKRSVGTRNYSVEENSDGDLVNYRLNLKWPQPVKKHDESRYLKFDDDDSVSDRLQSERRSRKNRSKKEKKEKKERKSKREEREKKEREKKERKEREKKEKKEREKRSKREEKEREKSEKEADSSRARSPLSAEGPYISLSVGSDKEEEADRSKCVRRERKVVQTSPQASHKSWRSGYQTDDEGKAIDSIVFDTRSQMRRYQESSDILPTKARQSSRSAKVTTATENEVYKQCYVGVKKARAVEKMLVRPGQFVLYYEKPRDGEIPMSVNLKVAYRNSDQQAVHYPIRCFQGTDGQSHYVVMQNEHAGKMFTSIPSLVKHYSLSVSH